MEKTTQDQLNEILQNLGFNDPYIFIKLMLGVYLQTQINELQTKIKSFEQKYECSFEDFQVRFHEINQFSMFEKEDDGIEWNVTNFQLDFIKKQREMLSFSISYS